MNRVKLSAKFVDNCQVSNMLPLSICFDTSLKKSNKVSSVFTHIVELLQDPTCRNKKCPSGWKQRIRRVFDELTSVILTSRNRKLLATIQFLCQRMLRNKEGRTLSGSNQVHQLYERTLRTECTENRLWISSIIWECVSSLLSPANTLY